jgi:UDP-glucose 4-epimerase
MSERRVLLSLGVDSILGLRVPRSKNPYQVARVIKRLAEGNNPDAALLRKIIETNKSKAILHLPFCNSEPAENVAAE